MILKVTGSNLRWGWLSNAIRNGDFGKKKKSRAPVEWIQGTKWRVLGTARLGMVRGNLEKNLPGIPKVLQIFLHSF